MNLKLAFDTETTGLPDWKVPSDSLHQPHIVQIAANLIDIDDDYKTVNSMNMIIKPDGWLIPPLEDDANVHGITTEYALEVGIPEDVALTAFIEMWALRPTIIYNKTFDQRIIRIALKRFMPELLEPWKNQECECVMKMAKDIMQLEPKGRFGWKSPKLTHAFEHFTGKEMKNAHDAVGDIEAMIGVYRAIKSAA